ncbi:MAG TPA: hypothetical protein VGL73_08195, partial [Caulobacteraceae bacterium]
QLTVIKSGLGAKYLAEPDAMMSVLKAALPHQSEFIDKYKSSSFPFLVDELGEKLLSLLSTALEKPGTETDAVGQAAEIIAAVKASQPRDINLDATVKHG